jgi:Carbonic anhydrase
MPSRRRFLRDALAGSAAMAVTGQMVKPAAPAETALSPDTALRQLMDGNGRFAAGRMTSFDEDLSILKAKTVDKQEPFAAVLSCADSRVPVELIFDQSIGHVFVTRVAGNVATSPMIASLEYGVAVLGTKARSRQLRSGQGGDRGKTRSRADQRALSVPSAGRRAGRTRSRGRDQGKCEDTGGTAAAILARAGRRAQAESAQNRCRLL